ncbi:OsmC family protein [Bacillus subtilis]|uniref:OsmC family protein n=1 Tax=Bacillus subtilis TaxID=1423 RepID=UPI002FFDBAD0
MADSKVILKAEWEGGVKGKGTIKSDFINIPIAIGKENGGIGIGARPKHILASSVQACYVATLASMMEIRGLPVESFTVDTEVRVSDDEFLIVHHPHIFLLTEASQAQVQSVQRLFKAAERGCTVGNMVKKAGIKIEVEGEVSII